MPEHSAGQVWKKWAVVSAYAVLYVAALAGGTAMGWIDESDVLKQIVRQGIVNEKQEEVFRRDNLNVLLLGLDEQRIPGGRVAMTSEGEPQPGRADSILVVQLDFADDEISALSIPRDTLASPSGYRTSKINSFMAVRGGGEELMKEAVMEVSGLRIDRVVVLNYDAFKEVVDRLGGIMIDVPKRMRYHDRRGDLHIDLEPGLQTLYGEDAMGFVRYRSDADDFKRQERQKQFLLALKDRVKEDPRVINRIADLAIDLSGGEFDAKEIASLARFTKDIEEENIHMGMIPVVEAPNYNLRVDNNRLEDTLRELHFIDQTRVSLKDS
ncbi:MAG: LCP family protein [Fimbriimonadaceae bacterium]